MSRKLALRLAVDFTALALFLLALAYYWLDNATHEVMGTAMFVLLMAHNTFNRRWYGRVPQREERRRSVDKLLVLGLLVAMVTLLVTSVMISQTVFVSVASPDAITARRIHVLAAYWALLLVAIHLGIRWRVVLNALHNMTGSSGGPLRAFALRLAGAGLAIAGIYASFQIGVGDKLTAQVSLEWWDFDESTWAFFVHHLAIVGLYAWLAHHAFHRIRGTSPR
jgi:hypothetical protein